MLRYVLFLSILLLTSQQRTKSVIVKSQGVAISQDGNSALNVSSSPGASASIGSSAVSNQAASNTKGRGKPSSIVVVVKSQGVAVSQGAGGAVGVSNSPDASVAVGGAAVINTTQPSSAPKGKPNITIIVKGQGVAVSQGAGAAIGIANSPSSVTSAGGAAVIETSPSTSKSSSSNAIVIKGQGVGIAQGTGAAIGINNSTGAVTSVGGVASVGEGPGATGKVLSKKQVGVGLGKGLGKGFGINAGNLGGR